jgi:hypothetical protein
MEELSTTRITFRPNTTREHGKKIMQVSFFSKSMGYIGADISTNTEVFGIKNIDSSKIIHVFLLLLI